MGKEKLMRCKSASFLHRRDYDILTIMNKSLLMGVVRILRQTKNYARIVGVILFGLGLIGFAFRSDDSLPDLYLAASLILGFWGIVSGLWDDRTPQS